MSTLADDVRVEQCPTGWHAWSPKRRLDGFGASREIALDQLKDFLLLYRNLERRYAKAYFGKPSE